MDALIEALQSKNFPLSHITALNALSSLSGHVNSSGKPELESWLLKLAGFDQLVMRRDGTEPTEMVWSANVQYSISPFIFFGALC